MASNFPSGLDSLTNPAASDNLDNPSHATQHANANDAIENLEAKVGIDSSAVTSSHAYRLDHVYQEPQVVTTFTTSALSLIASNMGALIRSSTTAQARVVLPTDAEVAGITVGQAVDIVQWGTGALEVVANAGATVRAATNTTSAYAQYSGLRAEKVAANLWWLVGDTK